MKLYRIETEFWGKDLNKKAILGYVVADSEKEIAEHINQKYKYGDWFGIVVEPEEPEEAEAYEEVEQTRQDYLANKGDFHTEYAGEFYDQKYGWEEIGEVADDQVAILRELGLLDELKMASK